MRSMSTVRRHCSWLSRSTLPQVAMPATFITTSTLPVSACVFAASATTAAWSLTSAASARCTVAPAARNSSAVRRRPVSSTSVSTSDPPRSATAKAVLRPSPLAAPVIRQRFPSNFVIRRP